MAAERPRPAALLCPPLRALPDAGASGRAPVASVPMAAVVWFVGVLAGPLVAVPVGGIVYHGGAIALRPVSCSDVATLRAALRRGAPAPAPEVPAVL